MVHRAESSPRRRVPGLVERTLEAVERSPEQFPIALRDIRKALVRRFPYVVYLRGPVGRDQRDCDHPWAPGSWRLAGSALMPNKRLKLAGALVLKEAVGSCPG